MIVEGWYDLTRAIDEAIPCYTPVNMPPYGDDSRCGDCAGCEDYGKVEEELRKVERAIEAALDETFAGGQRTGVAP